MQSDIEKSLGKKLLSGPLTTAAAKQAIIEARAERDLETEAAEIKRLIGRLQYLGKMYGAADLPREFRRAVIDAVTGIKVAEHWAEGAGI